jgi:hypothetical protein
MTKTAWFNNAKPMDKLNYAFKTRQYTGISPVQCLCFAPDKAKSN